MSYGVEVRIQGDSQYAGNQVFLATKEEAEAYSKYLFSVWTIVLETRVVERQEPANYAFYVGRLHSLRAAAEEGAS